MAIRHVETCRTEDNRSRELTSVVPILRSDVTAVLARVTRDRRAAKPAAQVPVANVRAAFALQTVEWRSIDTVSRDVTCDRWLISAIHNYSAPFSRFHSRSTPSRSGMTDGYRHAD